IQQSYPLGLLPKASVLAGIRYVAAAKTDHPDDHGNREGKQWNDRFAFTEVVEEIEDGEQRDQDGHKRGCTVKTNPPWLLRRWSHCRLTFQANFACVSSSYSLEISWPV